MEGEKDLLAMELGEQYSFARHHFQLLLGWYTFFLTVNFAAIGWFTSVLLTGSLEQSLPSIFIALFFITQQIFSYIAIGQVTRYFVQTHARCVELLNKMASNAAVRHLQPQTPIPIEIYVKIMDLMRYTLISFCFFWIVLTAVSIYVVPL